MGIGNYEGGVVLSRDNFPDCLIWGEAWVEVACGQVKAKSMCHVILNYGSRLPLSRMD